VYSLKCLNGANIFGSGTGVKPSRYTHVSRKQYYKIVVGVPEGKITTETVKCSEG
jgi:hypothetical protein